MDYENIDLCGNARIKRFGETEAGSAEERLAEG
jgi:hypothetical protein